MKFGIYYAYWETGLDVNYIPYIEKVKKLGFDILEIGCWNFDEQDDAVFHELRKVSEAYDIKLTGGYGPRRIYDLASTDATQLEKTFKFYEETFRKMEIAGMERIGGALYSYWPIDSEKNFDKAADFERSVTNMRKLADMAANYGVHLNMESLNRFEGYLINTAQECIEYVKAVDKPNVHVMLDTFHMNIEEDSFVKAIKDSGSLLGHFHVGEANRRPPFAGGRMPWSDIGNALKEINYDEYVVFEPFVQMGGQVGKDISLWRDLSEGATMEQLDESVRDSLRYLKNLWKQ